MIKLGRLTIGRSERNFAVETPRAALHFYPCQLQCQGRVCSRAGPMNILSPDQNKSCKTNTKGGALTLIAALRPVQQFF